MRTSFDPEHEIPRLQKWFQDNQHPPRELMIRYLEELNSLDSRKGRRPLDLTNIIYWFKNARAAHRRASRNFEGDGNYEMEDNHDLSPNGSEGIQGYVNNKHPMYMLPYPFQGMYGSHDTSCDPKEPCDLSQPNKSRFKDASPTMEEKITNREVQDLTEKKMEIKQELKEEKREGSVTSDQTSDSGCSSRNTSEESVPVLPNRNAVYVLPYTYHGSYGPKVQNQDGSSQDPKEPCDLSNSHKSKSSQGEINGKKEDDRSDKENRDYNENNQFFEEERGPISNNKNQNCGGDTFMHEIPRRYHEEVKQAETNGVYHSGSEGEDMESDYDDDQSYDGSDSSHDNNSLSVKQEMENGDRSYFSNKMSQLQQSAAAGLHQPLHIPHFPHPLAMHYFPMNSHFLQQTARYQQHQQQQTQNRQQLSPSTDHHKSGLNESHSHSNSHHRKRRTRVFIDPMSEIPKLEKWFAEDTHPSSYMIDKYCEELNRSEYRQKFPKLEAKNVQLWFKNHRAKVKRMRVSSVDLHGVSDYKMEKC